METEKIITELYSLRAGLSLIAKEMDKLNGELAVAEERKRMETAQARATADRQIQQCAARQLPAYAEPKNEDSDYTKAAAAYKKAEDAAKKAKRAWNEADFKMRRAVEEAERTERENKWAKHERSRTLKFGILFILLHLACAGLAYFNFYLLGFKGYLFIPVLVVSLTTAIIEWLWWYKNYGCEKEYDPDNPDYASDAKKFFYWLGYAFIVAVNLALMIIGFADGSVNTAMLVVVGISAGFNLIFTLIMIIGNLDKYRHRNVKSIQSMKDEYVRLEAEYNRLHSEELKLLSVKAQCESRYNDVKRAAESEYETRCGQIEEQYKKTCATSMQIHSKTGTEIWNMLVKTYGSLLDVRDWKILDLVIWQLETHRAETLREALQLADRETQTDRIVGVLQSASEAVRYQIQMGFGRLQLQINDNFKTLANEFASSARYMSSAINTNMQELQANQTKGMLELNRGLDKIVSQSSLQTALLEKAGTSSGKLIEAVNKLRES